MSESEAAEASVEAAAPAEGESGEVLFRREATARNASPERLGDVLRLEPRWSRISYPLVMAAALFAIVYVWIANVHEYASGPAIVRLDGRRTLSATSPGVVDAVLIAPGEHVAAGQVLARFHDAAESAEVARARLELETHVVRLLRDPADAVARQALVAVHPRLAHATAMLEQRVVRAPAAGIVSDVRIRAGQYLTSGDVILGLVPDGAPVLLVAVLPGSYRPGLRVGQSMRFSLDGYKFQYRDLEIESVGTEVVGPNEIKRYLGQQQSDAVSITGPSVVVRARIPQRSFVADSGKSQAYFDGLTGVAEVRVRTQPIALAMIPYLRSLVTYE